MLSRKNIIKIILGLAFLLALSFWFTKRSIAQQMMQAKRFLLSEHTDQFKRGWLPSDNGMETYESLQIFAKDSTALSAYYIPSRKSSTKTIVGLHDFASCKEHMFTMARWAHSQNINILIFDSRAQGQSEGNYFSYGKKESQDLSAIIDWIKQRDKKQKIGLWSFSGATATALQAMATDKRIAFAILENPYSKNKQLAASRHRNFPDFINSAAFQQVQNTVGIGSEFDPIALAPKIKQNILVIHGEKNTLIPIEDGTLLFHELASQQKYFYPIKGAHHYNLWHYGEKALESSFQEFLQQQ